MVKLCLRKKLRLWKKEVIRPLILLLEAEIFYFKDARLAQLDFGAMHDRVDGCGGSVVGVELGLDRSEAGRPLCCRGILRRDFGKSSVKNVNLGPVPQAAKVKGVARGHRSSRTNKALRLSCKGHRSTKKRIRENRFSRNKY